MTMGERGGGTAETAEEVWWPFEDGAITPDTRVRVRENNTPASGESDMPDCGSAEGTADPTAVTDRARSGWFGARLVGRLHPPDICGDRPGLTKLSAYAHHGAGAPADGPLRTVQVWWYRLVCLPITAWAYWKAWALERPFRGTPILLLQIGWWLLNIVTLIRFL